MNSAERDPVYSFEEVVAGVVRAAMDPWAWVRGAAFLALVAAFLWQASYYWNATIDDAYIGFRFADNFARGFGFVFNEGGERVEGFTNFLWVVMIAGALRAGIDAMLAAKVVGLACSVGTMFFSWRLAASLLEGSSEFRVPGSEPTAASSEFLVPSSEKIGRDEGSSVWLVPSDENPATRISELGTRNSHLHAVLPLLSVAFLAFNSHFAHWSLMGLETPAATMLVVATYARFVREMDDARCRLISPWLAALAAMTRFDALFYLLPVGLLGVLLVARSEVSLRRFATWGCIAAVVFGSYYAWKVSYFGDWLPNTYYAKQRLVEISPTRARGIAHLKEFYFDQGRDCAVAAPAMIHVAGSIGGPGGALLPKLAQDSDLVAGMKRAWWLVMGGAANSFWWVNWWLGSLLVLLAIPRARTACLVLLPIAMNVYYLYHVDGDWMPGFRMFQVILPCWGVAGAVALGTVVKFVTKKKADVASHSMRGRDARAPLLAICAFALIAMTGIAREQLRIGYAYVFGRDPMWYPRVEGWGTRAEIGRRLRAGFAGPLDAVSDWLLLNTTSGATIYMSDVGQPMWFCPHLRLLDGCGLCDKKLGHAPSTRGDLKPESEILRGILREQHLEHPTPAARREAVARDFAAHLERNASYVLDETRPEYVLLFENHFSSDSSIPPIVYPEIAARIHDDPDFRERYEFIWSSTKAGTVLNRMYRLRGAATEADTYAKLERIAIAIARNPRMHDLVGLALDQWLAANDPELHAAMRGFVSGEISRIADDSNAMCELASKAREGGDSTLAESILDLAEKAAPEDPEPLRTRGDIAWRGGDLDRAILRYREAVGRDDRADMPSQRSFAAALAAAGRDEEALAVRAMIVRARPLDPKGWSELAQFADIATSRAQGTAGARERFAGIAKVARDSVANLSPGPAQ